MASNIRINLGGDGAAATVEVEVCGSACRVEAFRAELIRFTNDWKRRADSAGKLASQPRPCGCGEEK